MGTRIHRVVITGLAVLLMAAGPAVIASSSTRAAAAVVGPNSPNILLVHLDDARYDALTYLPKTRGWLGSTSRRYLGHRAAIPSCCPSRSAVFTGRYPHNNGVRLQSQAPSLDKDHTLMRYLKDAGYRTAMAGKFLVDWPGGTAPPYFDKHTVIQGGYTDYPAWVDGKAQTVATYSTTFLANRLRGYLTGFEAQDSTPWFAYYAPQAPHVAGGWKSLAQPEAKYAATAVPGCAKAGEADRSDKPKYLSDVPPDPAHVKALCQSQIRTLWGPSTTSWTGCCSSSRTPGSSAAR